MVPAEGVLVLEGCARKGIAVVTVYSDGFTEAGPEGQAMQQALVARARELGVRLLGPNSIGMINVAGQVPLSVNAALACDTLTAGRVAFVSQSGTMLGAGPVARSGPRPRIFADDFGGDESDLAVGEITQLLVDDPQTDVILLFLETLRDAPALADAARAAHRAGKSIAVFKLGRSEVGAQLAVSHTGALAGSDAACDAFFRRTRHGARARAGLARDAAGDRAAAGAGRGGLECRPACPACRPAAGGGGQHHRRGRRDGRRFTRDCAASRWSVRPPVSSPTWPPRGSRCAPRRSST